MNAREGAVKNLALQGRGVPMGAWGRLAPPPNAHETAKKLVIKQIL